MVVRWDESSVKRDRKGRFSRFQAGNIPSLEFMDPDAADAWGAEHFNTASLSVEEAGALKDYKDKAFDEVNAMFREDGFDLAVLNISDRIDDVMARNETPEDVWVTRAVTPEAFGGKAPDELVGSTFEDPAYMSTTLNEELPPDFAPFKQTYPAILRLKVPKGTPAFYPEGLDDEDSEQELLLGRGRRFDITGVREMPDGRWEVFGEVRADEGIESLADATGAQAPSRRRRRRGGIDPEGDNVIYDPSGIVIVTEPETSKPSDMDVASIMSAYPDATDLLWGDNDIRLKEPEPEGEPDPYDRYGRRIGVTDRPISADIDVTAGGKVGQDARAALEAIDSVHRDGVKRSIPIKSSRAKDEEGAFRARRGGMGVTGEPIDIAVSENAAQPRLTVAHEVGHYLDFEALGASPENFTSARRKRTAEDGVVSPVMDAVEASPLAERLRDMRTNPAGYTVRVPSPNQEDRLLEMEPSRAYLDYLLEPEEMFARAYAQFIAARANDPVLSSELDARRSADRENGYPLQWSDEEFQPIAAAFDEVFGGLGWLTSG